MQGFITQKKLLITNKTYNQAIEVKHASVFSNAEIIMNSITEDEEQIFILYKVEEDFEFNKSYYYIVNILSELLLTINGKNVVQSHLQNIDEQKFALIEMPNGSDKVLEVFQESNHNIALCVNHFSYGYTNQLFMLKESLRKFDETSRLIDDNGGQNSKYQIIPNVPLNIQCVHSNLFIDVFEHSTKKNSILVQWSQNFKNNQKFILERVELVEGQTGSINLKQQDLNEMKQKKLFQKQRSTSLIIEEPIYHENVFYVRCLESSLYWTIEDNSKNDGSKLVQDQLQSFAQNSHQRFIIQTLINGNVHIQPFHSKKYLGIEGDPHQCGARLIQFHKNYKLNQQFSINYC